MTGKQKPVRVWMNLKVELPSLALLQEITNIALEEHTDLEGLCLKALKGYIDNWHYLHNKPTKMAAAVDALGGGLER